MITPPKKTYKIPTSYTSSQMLEKNGNITWWGGTYEKKENRKGNLFMCCMRGFVCQGAVQGVIFNIFSYYTSPFEGKFEIMYKAYTPRHLIHFCVVNV